MSVLSLKSFHIVFIGSAIVLTAGLGIWGILNDYPKAGSLSLAVGALFVRLARDFGAAVVCATHDPLLIEQADETLRLG